MIYRIISFIAVLIGSVFLTPLLSLPLACLYAFYYFAPELILLGFFIDIYFGQASQWPIYIIGTTTIVLAAEASKQYLLFKTPSR